MPTVGDCLQEILDQPAAGKHPTRQMVVGTQSEAWKDQVNRLYFQNVNELRLQDSAVDILETFLQLKNIAADIFGIANTQLHCRNQHVQQTLQDCKRRIWDQCKIFLCSTEEQRESQRRPGGTLLGVTGALVGRVCKQHMGKYGRWTQVQILGRDGCILTVICAYQVVQDKGTYGDRTKHSQLIRLMRLDGISDPNPRQAFIRDLKSLVKSLHTAHHNVILIQ
jgi:hypothetical protein